LAYTRACTNWERKSNYLLTEIVKIQVYIDTLDNAIKQRIKRQDERQVARLLASADVDEEELGQPRGSPAEKGVSTLSEDSLGIVTRTSPSRSTGSDIERGRDDTGGSEIKPIDQPLERGLGGLGRCTLSPLSSPTLPEYGSQTITKRQSKSTGCSSTDSFVSPPPASPGVASLSMAGRPSVDTNATGKHPGVDGYEVVLTMKGTTGDQTFYEAGDLADSFPK
jgi:hypothetical protein